MLHEPKTVQLPGEQIPLWKVPHISLCCDHITTEGTDRNSSVTWRTEEIRFYNSNLQSVSKPFEAPQRRSGGLRFTLSGLNHTIVHQSFTKHVRVDAATYRIIPPGTSNDHSGLSLLRVELKGLYVCRPCCCGLTRYSSDLH